MTTPARRPASPVRPIDGPVLRARRAGQVGGLSRRSLLRSAIGAGVALWFVEVTAGTAGFLWSAVTAAGGRVRIGTFASFAAMHADVPVADGFPGYAAEARAFIVLVDPARGGWRPGADSNGDGSTTNVRALSQRCPHLGCRPNPCLEDYWFHCPCHQSRYDRLGIKAAGERYGPAPRGMDRHPVEVDATGVLTVDTGRITLGPLPVALGAPGLIPPLVEDGCI